MKMLRNLLDRIEPLFQKGGKLEIYTMKIPRISCNYLFIGKWRMIYIIQACSNACYVQE